MLPVLDYENLKPSMVEKGEWEFRSMLMTANIVALCFITFLNFENIKGTYAFVSLVVLTYPFLLIFQNKDAKQHKNYFVAVFYTI